MHASIYHLCFFIILVFMTFSFVCGHTHTHTCIQKMCLMLQSGVSLVGAGSFPFPCQESVSLPLLTYMSCQTRLWFSDAVLCEVSSETYPSWEQERWGEPVREKYSEWEQEKKIWVEGRMGENKSKGASDVNNNEEHGGGCQGGHHDITTCKSATAFYC